MMSSFLIDPSEMKQFLVRPRLDDQEGIMFAYAAPAEVLAKLLPPPLKLVAPMVCGYVVQMGKPSFGGPYLESVLYVLANYRDKVVGAYPFNLMLHGPGAETGIISGREGAGIPKKMADHMEIRRNDQQATAIVERHGVRLLEVTWTAGTPNDPQTAQQIFSQLKLNSQVEQASLFYKYQMDQAADGTNVFHDAALVSTQQSVITDRLEPGNLRIKVASSEDDPYGELKVIKPLGAAWYHVASSVMHNTIKLEDADAGKIMPYLVSGRYDRGIINPNVTTFII